MHELEYFRQLMPNALMSGRALPTFLELLGPRDGRTRSALTIILGVAVAVTTLIGAETALGFVFDPRYRDFPFAALTMAVVPFSTRITSAPAAVASQGRLGRLVGSAMRGSCTHVRPVKSQRETTRQKNV